MALLKRGGRDAGNVERSWSPSQLSAPWGSYTITDGGHLMTVDRALQDDAVWACVDLIASSVASLPVDVIRMDGDIANICTVQSVGQGPAGHAAPYHSGGDAPFSLIGLFHRPASAGFAHYP